LGKGKGKGKTRETKTFFWENEKHVAKILASGVSKFTIGKRKNLEKNLSDSFFN
jgi:hypothetical protein